MGSAVCLWSLHGCGFGSLGFLPGSAEKCTLEVQALLPVCPKPDSTVLYLYYWLLSPDTLVAGPRFHHSRFFVITVLGFSSTLPRSNILCGFMFPLLVPVPFFPHWSSMPLPYTPSQLSIPVFSPSFKHHSPCPTAPCPSSQSPRKAPCPNFFPPLLPSPL